MKIELMTEYGSQLLCPHVDTLNGNKLNNLKELLAQTENHMLRVTFVFYEERKSVLLISGNKKGKNEKLFHLNLIKQAKKSTILRWPIEGNKNG